VRRGPGAPRGRQDGRADRGDRRQARRRVRRIGLLQPGRPAARGLAGAPGRGAGPGPERDHVNRRQDGMEDGQEERPPPGALLPVIDAAYRDVRGRRGWIDDRRTRFLLGVIAVLLIAETSTLLVAIREGGEPVTVERAQAPEGTPVAAPSAPAGVERFRGPL